MARPCRADFHGFVIIRGIEDVSTIRRIFEKLIIERGGMSDLLHHRDTTRVSENTGLNAPQGWFEWIQYTLKANRSQSGHIDRDRTRGIMSAAGIKPIGELDDLLLMYRPKVL